MRSLAAGLILAADRIAPVPEVWATGEWDPERGMVDIGGLEEKLDLVAECRARTVFIPAGQSDRARLWNARRGEPLEIGLFTNGGEKRELRATLREYLAQLGARPQPAEDFEIRVRYYLRQTDPELRRRYYIEALLPELAEYYRSQFPQDCRPTHLVTIASDSPELVVLLAQTLQAERCLILFTTDKEGPMRVALEAVERSLPDCVVHAEQIDAGEKLPEEMKRRVERFMGTVDPSQVLFDLTPGTKEMSIIMAVRIAPPGSLLFYLRHEMTADRIAIPGMRTPLLERASRIAARPADLR